MGWRSLVPIRAGQTVEVTLALNLGRVEREYAVLVSGRPAPGGHVSGTGFTWSDALGAPYFYIPPGPAREAVTFNMSFDHDLTELRVDLKRIKDRTTPAPASVLDAMVTCYEVGEPMIALSARMERVGPAA